MCLPLLRVLTHPWSVCLTDAASALRAMADELTLLAGCLLDYLTILGSCSPHEK